MKRTAAVLSIIFLALWYSNENGLLLIPAMILGGAVFGIFGLFTETVGWLFLASGVVIGYDGFLPVGIAVAILGIIVIRSARTHGLLYDIVFVSGLSVDFDDEP